MKVAGALLNYFSILPSSAFVDPKSFIDFAIEVNFDTKVFIVLIFIFQYSGNIHVRVQLCAFKFLGTLGRLPGLQSSFKSQIVNKLLQAINHDDARVRAEALRTIVRPNSLIYFDLVLEISGESIQM